MVQALLKTVQQLFYRIWHTSNTWLINQTPWYLPKWVENICPYKRGFPGGAFCLFIQFMGFSRQEKLTILKEIHPEYSFEGLMLRLNLQYLGHLMWRPDSLEKTLMLGKIEGRRRRGWQKVRWLDGITDSVDMSLSKLLGAGDGQGCLACCSPRGLKESDMTERLNSNRNSASGKEPACQCRRLKKLGFDPWVRKIPWKWRWQSNPVFLPGGSHGQRSLVGYSP